MQYSIAVQILGTPSWAASSEVPLPWVIPMLGWDFSACLWIIHAPASKHFRTPLNLNLNLVQVEHWWYPSFDLSWSSLLGKQRYVQMPPGQCHKQTPGSSGLPYQSQAVIHPKTQGCLLLTHIHTSIPLVFNFSPLNRNFRAWNTVERNVFIPQVQQNKCLDSKTGYNHQRNS